MHEVSLVSALFDEADRAIGAHAPASVRLIRVRLGSVSGVESDLFLTAFSGIRELRGYENAELAVEAVAGDALVLERIELEVPDV